MITVEETKNSQSREEHEIEDSKREVLGMMWSGMKCQII